MSFVVVLVFGGALKLRVAFPLSCELLLSAFQCLHTCLRFFFLECLGEISGPSPDPGWVRKAGLRIAAKACEEHSASNSDCLQTVAGRCSGDLSDTAWMLHRPRLPSCESATSRFHLHPSCHQQPRNDCGFHL